MEAMRQAGAILLVFALLGAAYWALRRRGAVPGRWLAAIPGRERTLVSIERLPLTPQHALHLVRIGDRELVVATHPQGCGLLTESRKGVVE